MFTRSRRLWPHLAVGGQPPGRVSPEYSYEDPGSKAVRSRSIVVAVLAASVLSSACTSGGHPAPETPRNSVPGTVEISSAGGTATTGSATIVIPRGAVASTTRLRVVLSSVSPSSRASTVVKPVSDKIDVSLQDGAQPSVPVTLTARPTDRTEVSKAEPGSIMLLSRDGRTGAWNLSAAKYDENTNRLTAQVRHFSILGFVHIDVTAPLKAMVGAFKSTFELDGAAKPACAGKPVTVDGTTFSLPARYVNDGDGIVWPCLAAGASGTIELRLANATGLPWLIRSKPRANVTDSGSLDINRAVLLSFYHQYLTGGRFSQSMVLPGATNTYAFEADALPGFVDMQVDGFAQQAMALVWALRFALDLFYPEAKVVEALGNADFGSCLTDLVATATGTFDAKTVGAFFKAFFSCADSVVDALGGSLVGVAKVVVAAMSGGVSLILNDLIAAYRTIAGKDHTRVTVSVSQPVLGRTGYVLYGEGWGSARPTKIFNGGDPSGLVTNIRWQSWGGTEAFGVGKNSIFKPGGGYYPDLVTIELRASDLGRCPQGGQIAYRRLYFRVPSVPGGPLGPWTGWSGSDGDICTYG
jgi:hypothetical protein